MAQPMTVFTADAGELLFWLIVAVITIVSQIAKAKQNRAGSSPHPLPEDEAVNPQAELRRFLESLAEARKTGTAEAIPVPARSPPPPVPRQRPAQKPAGATAMRIARPARPPQPPPMPRQAELRAQAGPVAVRAVQPQTQPCYRPDAGAATARELVVGKADQHGRHTHALQRAFILQEVFGPSIALRRSATASAPPALQ